MKNKKLLVFFAFLLILFSACISKPEAHCCVYSKAANGECYFYDNWTAQEGYKGETPCTIYKDDSGEPVYCDVGGFNYSVCSEWKVEVCAENCSGMVCGNLKELLLPSYGYSEYERLKDNPEFASTYIESAGFVVGLLHAECKVAKVTPSFEKALSQGAVMNSFRFGAGDSFEEYEQYAYLFPFSDKVIGEGIDRYTNYFFLNGARPYCIQNDSAYTCSQGDKKDKNYPSFYECEWECRGINPTMVCSADIDEFSLPNSPFGNELGYVKHWYGGLFWADVEDEDAMGRGNTFWSQGKVDLQYPTDKRTANVGVLKFAKENTDLTAASVGIFGFKEIPTYYANVLPRHSIYSTQIFESEKAEFECLSSGECASGVCSTLHYKRSACIDTETNKSIECGCSYESGSLICKPTRTEQVPASDEQKYNVDVWDGETLGVSVSWSGLPTYPWFFTHPEKISRPKTSVVDDKILIFLSRDVKETLGEQNLPLPNNQETRWAILHYCQIVPTSWSGCQEGGTYVVNFVENCMSSEYQNDIAVCYPPKFGLDGSSLGDSWKEICADLTDDDFRITQGEGGFDAYASAAIVIRKNSNGNFGKCMVDDFGSLTIREYGWCEPASFNTIAVEHLYPLNKFYDPVGGDPNSEALPIEENGGIPRIDLAGCDGCPLEDFENDYNVNDIDEVNKRIANYCPLLEILPPLDISARDPNDWEGESVGDVYNSGNVLIARGVDARVACGGHRDSQLRCDAYGLTFGCKDATRKDGDVYDARVSWPDYYPHWEYMKDKLSSYLVAGVMPVLYAEDDELYKTYYGCDRCYLPEFTIYKEDATFAYKLLRDIYMNVLHAANQQNYSAGDYEESASSFGPIIVAIGNTEESNGYEIDLEKRAEEVKGPCPNCMVAIATTYKFNGNEGREGWNFNEKNKIIESLSNNFNLNFTSPAYNDDRFCARYGVRFGAEECNELYKKTDLVMIEASIDLPLNSNITHYEYFTEDIINLSRKVVYKFGKPSLIIVKNIGEGGRIELMKYTATQRARLVNAGIIGMHFSSLNISTGEANPAINMEKYCGVEYAAERTVGLKPLVYFEEQNVMSECNCTACTPENEALGLCNGHYLGNPELPKCSGYDQNDSNSQVWPRGCFPKSLCIDDYSNYEVHCDVMAAGESQHKVYNATEIMGNPGLYADIIASIKGPDKLCDLEEGRTYSKIKMTNANPLPILFSTIGGEEECILPESPYYNFCGFDIPLKERDADCWLEKKLGKK